MYAAYLDESFDNDNQGVFAVAGLFGDGWDWLNAEPRWDAILKRYNLRCFKANKVRSSPRAYSDFVQVLVDAHIFGWGVVIPQVEFLQHFANAPVHANYKKSPFMLAYHHSFIDIAMAMRQMKATRSYVCHESAMYAPTFVPSFARLKELNPLSAPHMASCFLETDKRCIPLQMADLLASEMRIQGRHWLTSGSRELTPVIQRLRDGNALWKLRGYNNDNLEEVRELLATKSLPGYKGKI